MPRRSSGQQSPTPVNVDTFLGFVRDRSGTEMRNEEFRTITNLDNVLIQSLRKRLGSAKYAAQTEASGAKVQELMTFTDSAGTKTYIKIAGGQLRKSTGGAWSTIGSAVFTDTQTFIRQLNTRKTGASADATGTSTASDFTTVTDGAASMTINAHLGKVLSIGGQQKVIVGNSATVFYLGERFDDAPANGTYNVYPRQQEFFIANGTNFYKCDGSSLTQLDTSVYAAAFTGLEVHDNRLWAWKGPRAYWSDIGLGEHFSRNSWKDFSSDIQSINDLAEIMVVHEKKKVTIKMNENPDQFFWRTTLSGYGNIAPKSAAVFPGYMFFLDDQLGVMMLHLKDITTRNLTAFGDEIMPVSTSQNYVNTLILGHTAAELAAAVGFVDHGNYYLRIGTDLFVLHAQASIENTQRVFNTTVWIWTTRTYPSAMIPNAIGKFDTALVFGGATNGQVYEVNKAATYDDDGTAITQTIEKCDWLGDKLDQKNFDALYVRQDASSATATYKLYIAANGGTTFSGTEDLSWDSAGNAAVDRLITNKFPSNPGDAGGKKDSGIAVSYKIEEIGSVLTSDIELIVLHFFPGVSP